MSAAEIFGRERALVGMVHAGAMPGTPRHDGLAVTDIARRAADEARTLAGAGFDAVLVENMHDVPYLARTVGPEVIAGMTVVASAVRDAVDVPIGIQVLAGANLASLAIAHAVGGSFIRVEGFVFAAVADEGLLAEADAGPLLRERRRLGADGVRILADIRKKHSAHALTADVDVGEMAAAAEFFGADGIIVTGVATGRPIRVDDLGSARVATRLPLVVGSGVNPESVESLFAWADALIVGSWLKHDGHWANPVDAERAREIVQARDALE